MYAVMYVLIVDKVSQKLQCNGYRLDRSKTYTGWHYSVARGGGGGGGGQGGNCPPPPNNAFSEFCRYIWKFVGTC